MRYLVVLKRIEIWLLLGVVVGLLVFSLRPEEPAEPEPESPEMVVIEPDSFGGDVPEAEAKETLVVDKVGVKKTQQGKIIELTLLGRSPGGKDLELDETSVSVTTESGDQVNFFFEPFRETVLLAAEEDSLATVRLWLEQPADMLWVDIQGEKLKAELPD